MSTLPLAATSRGGMIATNHHLASAEGLRILQQGGNAIDAVLAAAYVNGVAQPSTSGIGGDVFAVLYSARDKRVYAINGSGPAPKSWKQDAMPARGVLSATVPGAVSAMETLRERWGSGKFSRADLLATAIRHAADGAPVAPITAQRWQENESILTPYAASRTAFLIDGRAPKAGEVFRQPDLARSLQTLAEGGAETFYRGALAETITRYIGSAGGALAREDFASYACEIVEPIKVKYRGHTLYTNPLMSQGIILLEEMALLDGLPMGDWRYGSTDAVHAMVEAKKLAFADRNATCGDPAFVPDATARILDPARIAERRRHIDMARAIESPAMAGRDGDTVYLCAADAEGNMVSFITSISLYFGCGEAIPGTGILLNNRGGRGFTPIAGHPNAVAPGKRAMNTIHAYLVELSDGRRLVGGCPGGDGQVQWNMQMLSALLDHGISPRDAIAAPRWESTPGTDDAISGKPFALRMEPGFDPETIEGLKQRGHVVMPPDPTRNGAAQMILRGTDGVYSGASDARADGCALGL